MSQDDGGYIGTRDDESDTSEFNAHAFLIRQLIGRIATGTLVEVVAVQGGGVGPIGYLDARPLVKMIDGLGNTTQHQTIYHLCYSRVQAGLNAIIMDPVAGDIGACLFADHDISAVKSTGTDAPPGSRRRFDMADGIYLFGASTEASSTPTQYIDFKPAGGGITMVSPGDITINGVVITPAGKVSAPGDVVAGAGGADQVGLQTHQHTVPNDSHGDAIGPTNAPEAGT
jgi:hypothetical protein